MAADLGAVVLHEGHDYHHHALLEGDNDRGVARVEKLRELLQPSLRDEHPGLHHLVVPLLGVVEVLPRLEVDALEEHLDKLLLVHLLPKRVDQLGRIRADVAITAVRVESEADQPGEGGVDKGIQPEVAFHYVHEGAARRSLHSRCRLELGVLARLHHRHQDFHQVGGARRGLDTPPRPAGLGQGQGGGLHRARGDELVVS
mmetsp:Transcript_61638/g.195052  ORF Transcript_61638/g.195052 Transcript_61638/m.195052 type:complete len:201 (-) Transcript_61638:561-1163(-)